MGLDNKIIFPDFQTLTLDKNNPVANYTREASGELIRIDGRSEIKDGLLSNVGILNTETNKYDINITTSKEYNFTQTSTKTISIEQPLRQVNDEVCDSIYKFTDDNYYLFKKVENRPYEVGDENNPLVITDGTTTNYDLGRAGYTEVQLTDFNPSIDFFGTTTTISCDSVLPSIEVKIPIDYAYNESKKKYINEEIIIEQTDIDTRKNIEIVEIEGQTFENLLQEPLENGKVINPVEMEGRECAYNGGKNTTVPLREIQGDTYINLLEDKIENATLKPVVRYYGDIVDGTSIYDVYKAGDDRLEIGGLNWGANNTDTNWLRIKDYIKVEVGAVVYFKSDVTSSKEHRLALYDIDKKFIKDVFAHTELKYVIEDNVSYIRFCFNAVNNFTQTIYTQTNTPYNLNVGDKATIDEIKGNTKLYHEYIPVLDASGNIFMSTLEDGWIDNSGMNTNNGFIRSGYFSAGDGVGNITFYAYNSNKELITLTQETNVTIRFYDKNTLTYKNSITTTLNRTGVAGISANNKGDLMRITFVNDSGVTNQSLIMGKINTVFSDAEPYSEPVIIGSKSFPIQSVGELYINELGEPILDELGKEQYKIDVISCDGLNMISSKADFWSSEGFTNGDMESIIIKVKPNTKYYYTQERSSWRGIKQVNSQGEAIKTLFSAMDRNEIFTTPSDCHYIKVVAGQVYGSMSEITRRKMMLQEYKNGFEYNDSFLTKQEVKSILLPQPLRSHLINGNKGLMLYQDRLYWDETKNRYCIDKKIIELKTKSNVNYTGQLNIAVSDDLNKIDYSAYQNTFLYEGCNWSRWDNSEIQNNIIGVKRYNVDSHIRINKPPNMSNDAVADILSNKAIVGVLLPALYETIETSITEKITLPCYDNSTYIYTNGTSSHDEINLPAIENLKGELTVTTVPLSTTAYIKPNTKYTMFMYTNCEVNYNLGGVNGLLGKTTIEPIWKDDFTLDGNGLEVSNTSFATSDYILATNRIFKIARVTSSWGAIYKYGENNAFISRVVLNGLTSSEIDLTSEPHVKYIRIVEGKNYKLSMNIIRTFGVELKNGMSTAILTTPQTLTNNTLTLLGEGNIGNVTLLEGDYTNSYVPEKIY